jgi:hypothetical protein
VGGKGYFAGKTIGRRSDSAHKITSVLPPSCCCRCRPACGGSLAGKRPRQGQWTKDLSSLTTKTRWGAFGYGGSPIGGGSERDSGGPRISPPGRRRSGRLKGRRASVSATYYRSACPETDARQPQYAAPVSAAFLNRCRFHPRAMPTLTTRRGQHLLGGPRQGRRHGRSPAFRPAGV